MLAKVAVAQVIFPAAHERLPKSLVVRMVIVFSITEFSGSLLDLPHIDTAVNSRQVVALSCAPALGLKALAEVNTLGHNA